MRYDKLWGFQNGAFSQTGSTKFNFLTTKGPMKFLRISKYEKKMKFDKISGYKNEGIPSNEKQKFKL